MLLWAAGPAVAGTTRADASAFVLVDCSAAGVAGSSRRQPGSQARVARRATGAARELAHARAAATLSSSAQQSIRRARASYTPCGHTLRVHLRNCVLQL